MARPPTRRHVNWYEQNRSTYEELAESVANTLTGLLRSQRIDFVSVSSRAKTLKSFSEKLQRKRYKEPQSEMTDLAGVRTVTLIDRDIARVAEVVRTAFSVQAEHSLDKGDELNVDQFGYRSVHFVCTLGPNRENLPENVNYLGIPFEIQVRTALQHAWAEIEHDRSYKFKGELPKTLKRRFHLLAGLLETADREFNAITVELEKYAEDAFEHARRGELVLELNSTTAAELLKATLSERGLALDDDSEAKTVSATIVAELRHFGIDSLPAVRELLTEDVLRTYVYPGQTFAGLLRDAMMHEDIVKYFEYAWRGSWQGLDASTYDRLCVKYGKQLLASVFFQRGIDFIDHDGEFVTDFFSPEY